MEIRGQPTTAVQIPCCLCGTLIIPNAANQCGSCLAQQFDLKVCSIFSKIDVTIILRGASVAIPPECASISHNNFKMGPRGSFLKGIMFTFFCATGCKSDARVICISGPPRTTSRVYFMWCLTLLWADTVVFEVQL